ncbi:hypothetical protein GCWU000324_02019 [Kingella oralis ATCC 51147]|uniref:Uncharacterized protein n=1 Tax=Kingella oralis ATCC 51147 TaxID=629741 RepID=C4GIZ6_9NEIS|nr:hypothetical protein GCWU000324_02019 [Kingella oralis ATCC 51147]
MGFLWDRWGWGGAVVCLKQPENGFQAAIFVKPATNGARLANILANP